MWRLIRRSLMRLRPPVRDTGLWDALQSAVVSLVGNVLGDTSVQDAVGSKVAELVSGLLGGGPLGDTGCSGRCGGGRVDHEPVDRRRLLSLVDTIAGGLFGSQDVVDAWAVAAGRLAKAALVGDLSSVLPEVIADLQGEFGGRCGD